MSLETMVKGEYPGDGLIASWFREGPEGCDISVFIARKACDWQREQDALIVDKRADANWSIAATHTLRDAATAIRQAKAAEGSE